MVSLFPLDFPHLEWWRESQPHSEDRPPPGDQRRPFTVTPCSVHSARKSNRGQTVATRARERAPRQPSDPRTPSLPTTPTKKKVPDNFFPASLWNITPEPHPTPSSSPSALPHLVHMIPRCCLAPTHATTHYFYVSHTVPSDADVCSLNTDNA